MDGPFDHTVLGVLAFDDIAAKLVHLIVADLDATVVLYVLQHFLDFLFAVLWLVFSGRVSATYD